MKSCGRDQDGHGETATEQCGLQLRIAGAGEHPGQQSDASESRLVRPQSHFIVGAAGKVIVDGGIEPSARLNLQIA
jgi:hypothetical protein